MSAEKQPAKVNAWMPAAFLVAGLAWYLNSNGLLPLPFSKSEASSSLGPNMHAVFATNPNKSEARTHALMAAEFFGGLARGLDFDATLTPPKCRTVGDLEDVRVLWRTYFARGWSFDSKYPGFGNTVGDYIDKTCGTDGSTQLTEAERAKWKAAYQAIEAECRTAARKLGSIL